MSCTTLRIRRSELVSTRCRNAFATNPNVKNWDPRFGFAYDVFGDHKTSLRAGFGMFHDPAQTYEFFSGYVGTPPFLALNQVNPSFPIPFQGGARCSSLPGSDLRHGLPHRHDAVSDPVQLEHSA